MKQILTLTLGISIKQRSDKSVYCGCVQNPEQITVNPCCDCDFIDLSRIHFVFWKGVRNHSDILLLLTARTK